MPPAHNLAGQYDSPIPTRFLAPIDCWQIPALFFRCRNGGRSLNQRRHKCVVLLAILVPCFILTPWCCRCSPGTLWRWLWTQWCTTGSPTPPWPPTTWRTTAIPPTCWGPPHYGRRTHSFVIIQISPAQSDSSPELFRIYCMYTVRTHSVHVI